MTGNLAESSRGLAAAEAIMAVAIARTLETRISIMFWGSVREKAGKREGQFVRVEDGKVSLSWNLKLRVGLRL